MTDHATQTSPPPGAVTPKRRRSADAEPAATSQAAASETAAQDRPLLPAAADPPRDAKPVRTEQSDAELDDGASVRLVLPLADPENTQWERLGAAHVDLQLRSDPESRMALRRLRAGLRKVRANLLDGRPVLTHVDTLRWLLQQIAQGGSVADVDP